MHLLFDTIVGDAIASSTPSLTAFPGIFLSLLRILPLSIPAGLGLFSPQSQGIAVPTGQSHFTGTSNPQVLILGGGVAGVMAAEALHRRGIDDFKIIEARETLGGRMKSFSFGAADRPYVLELGADWIHGTQTNDGPSNPIFELARKHNLSTQPNHYRGSMSTSGSLKGSPPLLMPLTLATYDHTGPVDYMQTFNAAVDNFAALTVGGGASASPASLPFCLSEADTTALPGDRILRGLVDATTRSGYAILGAKPRTPHEAASEYYQFDWEYAQAPEQSSWLASSWVTYPFHKTASRVCCSEER